jgi:predicted secreted protein
MNPIFIAAIYFVVWWLVLFTILPFGMHTQDEDGEVVLGTTRSAPVRPNLVKKAIATTIVAAIVVGALVFVVDYYGLTVWSVADWFDLRR